MGKDPPLFQGERKKADTFMNKVKKYLTLNYNVAGFNSPKKKVVLVLTFMQGPEECYSGSSKSTTTAIWTMFGASSNDNSIVDSWTLKQTLWPERNLLS